MSEVSVIGLDLAKHVFQVHGAEVLLPALTRLAGCASSICSAGQAPDGATTSAALTSPWATQWGLIKSGPLFW